jgi:hypothetical protein
MIYMRVIGNVFKLDTSEKRVWIDGDKYCYASDAESSLIEAIENDLLVNALSYSENNRKCRIILRAEIIEDDTEDTPTNNTVG